MNGAQPTDDPKQLMVAVLAAVNQLTVAVASHEAAVRENTFVMIEMMRHQHGGSVPSGPLDELLRRGVQAVRAAAARRQQPEYHEGWGAYPHQAGGPGG